MNINPINANNQTFQAKIKLKPAKKDILKMGLGTAETSLGFGAIAIANILDPANKAGFNEGVVSAAIALSCIGASTIENAIEDAKENNRKYLS